MTRRPNAAPMRPISLSLTIPAALCALALSGLSRPALAATPTVFHASATAYAGSIISLQGDSFGATPHVQFSHNDANWAAAPNVSVGINQLTAQIPTNSAPVLGLLTVRVSADGVTWSAPVFLNRAHAMSYDTPEVAPGSAFRVFGRSLSLAPASGATPTVRLVDTVAGLADYGQSQYGAVDTVHSTPYVLQATAPSGVLAGGVYSVFVSNGDNGNSSSGGETLADETLLGRAGAADVWNLGVPWGAGFAAFSGNVYNVKTDPRLTQYAVGDGVANDQPAIQAALTAATNAGGGVVYLPAGTYKLSYDPTQTVGLLLWSDVVLAGAGVGQTTVQYGFGTPSPQGWQGFGLSVGNGWNPVSDCGVADLTLQNVNTSGTWSQNLSLQSNINAWPGHESEELFLQRVHLQTNCGNSLPLGNADKVAIENSTLDQLGVSADYTDCLGSMTHFLYRGNTVNWSGGQAMNISDSADGVIENNLFTRNCNYALYPQTINTRCMDNNFDVNLAILNNTFAVVGGPVNDKNNDGETILNEGGGPFRADPSYGTATGATATTLQDTGQNWTSFSAGAIVAILSGTGMGQWRHVTGVTANTLTVDQPWTVTPDSTSGYTTTDWSAVNWLVAGNTLSSNRAGIMLYDCSSHDVAVVGNRLTNNGGILIQPLQYVDTSSGFHELDPIWDTQVVGNTVTDTNGAEPAFIGVSLVQWADANTAGAAALGVEVRDNALTASSAYSPPGSNEPNTEGYYNDISAEVYDRNDASPPGIVGTIFQGNVANNCASVYRVDWGVDQTSIADTVVNNVPAYLVDDITVVGERRPAPDTVVLNTWTDGDIGGPAQAGSAAPGPAGSAFTVQGGGAVGIWNKSDQLNFCWQPLGVNGTIIARVTGVQNTNTWARAGVLFRRDSTAGSAYAGMVVTPGQGCSFQYRQTAGATSAYTAKPGTAPRWVKLVRSGAGTTFTGYTAPDNNGTPGAWTQIGAPKTISGLAGALEVGLAVSSRSSALCTATFDHVSVTTP